MLKLRALPFKKAAPIIEKQHPLRTWGLHTQNTHYVVGAEKSKPCAATIQQKQFAITQKQNNCLASSQSTRTQCETTNRSLSLPLSLFLSLSLALSGATPMFQDGSDEQKATQLHIHKLPINHPSRLCLALRFGG